MHGVSGEQFGAALDPNVSRWNQKHFARQIYVLTIPPLSAKSNVIDYTVFHKKWHPISFFHNSLK